MSWLVARLQSRAARPDIPRAQKEKVMSPRFLLFAGLGLAFLLAVSASADGQIERGGAYYNPYTGGSAAAREGYNPYTGARGESSTRSNPYTGRTVSESAAYNPYTGREGATRSVSNSYTGRSTSSYAYRRR